MTRVFKQSDGSQIVIGASKSSSRFRGVLRTGLTFPAPLYDVWDFDDTAIAEWDTTATASTESELETAIETAMALGTTSSPQFHKITWTGGNVADDLAVIFAGTPPVPDKYGPHILVEAPTLATISGSLRLHAGVSNVKFKNFRIEPSSTALSGGMRYCVRPMDSGNGRRMAFENCEFGAYWRGGVSQSFPTVCGGSPLDGWELSIKNCTIRDVFEIVEGRAGWRDFRHNLVTGLIDDFCTLGVRDSSYTNMAYAYLLGNVILDMRDDPDETNWHCDFIQTGVPTDKVGAEYVAQIYGNIYIGDTYQQYPTMAGIIQAESAGGVRFETDWRDNVMLTTGTRGLWPIDYRTTAHRNMFALPPLAGAVPTSSNGWSSTPFRQYFNARGSYGTPGQQDVGVFLAGRSSVNEAGWASLPEPTIIADPLAALGTSNAYDVRFPNMTGLSFSGSTLLIPVYTGERSLSAVRSWVADTYEPFTTENGQGWEANGFNSPAVWF